MKVTKHRQEILNVLEHSDEALSAADIHSALPHINLATIYRNLESYVKTGVIKKLNFDAGEAQYEIQDEPHHHAICSVCKKVIHFSVDDEKLIKEFLLPGFTITNLEVTLHGTCGHKTKKNAKAK